MSLPQFPMGPDWWSLGKLLATRRQSADVRSLVPPDNSWAESSNTTGMQGIPLPIPMWSRVVLQATRLLLGLRLMRVVSVSFPTSQRPELEMSLHLEDRQHQLWFQIRGQLPTSVLDPLSARTQISSEQLLNALYRHGTRPIVFVFRTRSLP